MIRINGTNLFPEGSCTFRFIGQQEVTSSLGGSLSQIQCISPAAPIALVTTMSPVGLDADFSISMYVGEDSNILTFLYTAPLALKAILPAIGPVQGNYPIAISGSGMLKTLTCLFQQGPISRSERASWLSSTLVRCLIPPYDTMRSAGASTLDLRVVLINNEFQEETSAVFQYFEAVKVMPCGGPEGGGTIISVQLNRNVSALVALRNATCLFGPLGVQPATIMPGDRSRLVCVSPSGVTQRFGMNVSLDGLLFSQQSLPFLVYIDPAISRIRPNSGPVQGGTIVTVIGRNFLADGIRNDGTAAQVLCRFGDRPDDTSLQEAGRLPVYWSETAAEPLGSGPALRWVCLSPKFDGIYGNTSRLNLSYSNFSVPISLTFDGQFYTKDEVYFNYFQIQSLEPSLGPVDGETIVTIVGPNMGESLNEGRDMACLWNGEIVVQAYLIGDVSRRYASCASPAKPSNLFSMFISLEIRLNNVKNPYTLDQRSFLYYKNPEIVRMSPSSAPRQGGFVLLVSGLYFFDHEYLRCSFNTSGITKARYNYSLLSVECPIPTYLQGSPVAFLVSVSLNAQQYGHFGNKDATIFYYYGLDSVAPVAAALNVRSLNLTLRGTNLKLFDSLALPTCLSSVKVVKISSNTSTGASTLYVEKQNAPALAFDSASQTILCPIPTFEQGPQEIFLDVSLGQVSILGGASIKTADRLRFTVYSETAITLAVEPPFAQIQGGITIQVIGSGFMDSGSLVCGFRNAAVSATTSAQYITSTVATCLTPSVPFVAYPSPAHMFSRLYGEYTVVDVSLSMDGGNTRLQLGQNCTLVFLPNAQLFSVFPQYIPAHRATDILVRAYGSALSGGSRLNCMLEFSTQMLISPETTPCFFEDNCGNASEAFIPSKLSADSGYNAHGLTAAQRNLCTYLLISIPSTWAPQSQDDSLYDFSVLFTVDGQAYTTSSFQLSFFSIGSIQPSLGPSSRKATVTVYGTNFGLATQLVSCRFGTAVSRGLWLSSAAVSCPFMGLSPGIYPIDIQVSQGQGGIAGGAPWTDSGLTFLSYPEPVITQLEPSSGRNDLPRNITVNGANFAGQMLCRLKFNSSTFLNFNFVLLSDSPSNQTGRGLCFGIPKLQGFTGAVSVELTRNGIDWSGGKYSNGSYSSLIFLLFGLPSISGLVPMYG